jgi:hypothetical protein
MRFGASRKSRATAVGGVSITSRSHSPDSWSSWSRSIAMYSCVPTGSTTGSVDAVGLDGRGVLRPRRRAVDQPVEGGLHVEHHRPQLAALRRSADVVERDLGRGRRRGASSPIAWASRRAGSMVSTRVRGPARAAASPMAAAVVVLPTPPAPVVTRMCASRIASARSPAARLVEGARVTASRSARDRGRGSSSSRSGAGAVLADLEREHVGEHLEVVGVEGRPGQQRQAEHRRAGRVSSSAAAPLVVDCGRSVGGGELEGSSLVRPDIRAPCLLGPRRAALGAERVERAARPGVEPRDHDLVGDDRSDATPASRARRPLGGLADRHLLEQGDDDGLDPAGVGQHLLDLAGLALDRADADDLGDPSGACRNGTIRPVGGASTTIRS